MTADADAQLVIDEVHKEFEGVHALDGISLKLGLTEITGILGPNGSGKTTLLNVITGVHRADRGAIVWCGREITKLATSRIARLGVVRTFQQKLVFDEMTVAENVDVAAVAAGLRGAERKAAVVRALEMIELMPYARNLARDVPFGTARRLGVACCMPLKPRLLLLDEPAAGLSSEEAHELATVLRSLSEGGMGVCVIDHNMEFMTSLCARFVVMDTGRIIADGSPEVVQRSEEVMRAYLGTGA